MNNQGFYKFWFLFLPIVLFFYIGLFATMQLWYPSGLPRDQWQVHIVNFSVIYVAWVVIFYSNRLLDLESFRSTQVMIARLIWAFLLCGLAASVFFYFQPELLLTPRRFLIVHVLITGCGVLLWYIFARLTFPYIWRNLIFAHDTLPNKTELEELLGNTRYAGLKYGGIVSQDLSNHIQGVIIVFPQRINLEQNAIGNLFNLRNQGVRFVEFHELYERITRTVHLSVLTELWFIHFIDYGSHKFFDLIKRLIDIILGLVGMIIWIVTLPVIALLIKLTSPGPILFVQSRIGQHGKAFTLYKYRTMANGSASHTWTALSDSRITMLGKFLRATRLDELPQSLNILKGNMSIVGPRPEQVNIVEQLREQIPYYNERHIVKPGLTGWAQLHVYASTLEETKHKLQYDLYYIKHRSLIFDLEIILKTIYNIISFSGR